MRPGLEERLADFRVELCPGVAAELLEPTFRDVGVDITTSAGGMRYFTLDMGRRML